MNRPGERDMLWGLAFEVRRTVRGRSLASAMTNHYIGLCGIAEMTLGKLAFIAPRSLPSMDSGNQVPTLGIQTLWVPTIFAGNPLPSVPALH